MLKSKTVIVWALETSAAWKARVLDYPACAQAVKALPAFPFLQRLFVKVFVLLQKALADPSGGFCRAEHELELHSRLNRGLLCWQWLKASGVGKGSGNV